MGCEDWLISELADMGIKVIVRAAAASPLEKGARGIEIESRGLRIAVQSP
jgi:hypothetical protein